MYIHSVKLTNFKSIGDYSEDEIIIEPNVTAIIGKNESGKSNVLSGLSHVKLQSIDASSFSASLQNRINGQHPIKYIITLKFSATEISEFEITQDTTIAITQGSYVATGGILELYNKTTAPITNVLITELEKMGANPFQLRDQAYTNYQNYLKTLKLSDRLNIPVIRNALSQFNNHITSISADRREGIITLLKDITANVDRIISCFPVLFYRNTDRILNEKYKYDEIEKELSSPHLYPRSLLSSFVKAIGVSKDDFLSAAKSGSQVTQISTRRRIEKRVAECINARFAEFYKTENIELVVSFESGIVSFTVQSNDGELMMLSERSNGLRWYLNTFIDILANELPTNSVVFLLDEPGTSLHVNAQKELLSLFHHLASQGNQVVYTTHSPFMLDTEHDGLHRIRAVVKDDEGYTRIFKTAYDSRISPDSQGDTLTPIITALGMNLNCTFGPAHNKLNIVIEGMSDYIFLQTMSKICKLDMERFTLIPSIGASNCINICTILHGWGYPYFAVFDYDSAGVETGGEVLRKSFLSEFNRDYCYLADVSQDDVDQKTYKTDKFLIEDLVTHEEINRYCSEAKRSASLNKTLLAKLMCNASETEAFSFSENVINNFKMLFDRIIAYTSAKPY